MTAKPPVFVEAARRLFMPQHHRSLGPIAESSDDAQGTALVTGATSGLGYEFARLCAASGFRLVLVGRNRRRLAQISREMRTTFGTSTVTMAVDLVAEGAPQKLYASLARRKIPVDILVDNAGVGTYGRFHEIPLDDDLRLIRLNVLATSVLAKLFARDMAKRGNGRILIVASAAAFQSGPLMATYYASKAYLLSLAVAMRRELRGTGVTVTTFCPGVTKTEFHKRAHMMNSRLVAHKVMNARRVADAGFSGLMRGKTLVVPDLRYKIFSFLVRLSPRGLAATVAMNIQEPVH
jgi:uncharacterized protein